MDRDVNLLSGGELQRFAIGTVCVQQADVYGTLCTSIIEA
jgi:ATP-binding cassette subfamily E protein 1